MRTIKNFEKKTRGTPLFPCSIYRISKAHPDYVMPFHWHTEYEMISVKKGSIELNVNDAPFRAQGGDTLFVPGGTLHGGTPDGDDCVYDCVVFGSDLFPRAAASGILGGILYGGLTVDTLVKGSEHPEIGALAARLCDAFPDDPEGADELILRGLMQMLFGTVAKAGLISSAPPKTNKHISNLKEVLRYVEENYPEKITLGDLAGAAGVTPKYLCRSFASLTGKTPIEYLNEYRIDCACEMLRATDMSLVDIAGMCGFTDQSYFIRLFRRYKNMTPRAYRYAFPLFPLF